MSELPPNSLLEKINRCVSDNLSVTDFSLDDLCRVVGYSYPHLHRLVRQATGEKLSIYVRRQRLTHAMDLLQDAEMNVAEIAFAVGFKDPNYFTRVFRLEYGISPTEWRKKEYGDSGESDP